MKLIMLLADAVQAAEGKLYVLGGGWSIIGPDPCPTAIAIKIEVPWDETNKPHQIELRLLDEDGQPVAFNGRPMVLESRFEVGRPPGMKPGTPIDVPLAVNFGPLPFTPDRRYLWRCFIDGRTQEDWQTGFSTRPAKPSGS